MAAESAFGGLGATQRGPSSHPESCSHQVRAAFFCPPDGLKRQIMEKCSRTGINVLYSL